jgi:fructose-1,6-bisphosphatase/inositol monophosphatase family enzyme
MDAAIESHGAIESDGAIESEWQARLVELCSSIRDAARAALAAADASGERSSVTSPVRQGAGDVTYAIDECTESVVERWFREVARGRPLSLLTEDTGWRHLGPDRAGGVAELAGFDHGGPRIALDPIDGTRNLMADLRSAWTVVSFARAGAGVPRLRDLTLGIVSEIPDTRAALYRRLSASRGRPCEIELRRLDADEPVRRRELAVDEDARVDHGYFPFFRYSPAQRPALARIEARFFELAEEREGAELRHVFDDQYISNAGQLVLLALGTYRTIVDFRGWLARSLELPAVTSKPYDVAGAIVCARAAGCVVEGPHGAELDFPIDVSTPVDFVGYVNAATRARLAPLLDVALDAARG